MQSSTLVLNTDGTPISMLPLSVIAWQDAVRYLVLDKVNVLEWHEDWIVHSANWSTRVPAVIMMREFMKKKNSVRFSKSNVLLRDGFICQYCGISVSQKTATLDHVLPTSKGGKNTFENCTCACSDCNGDKGNDHRIKPRKQPFRPNYFQLVEQRKKLPFDHRHHSWPMYLGITV